MISNVKEKQIEISQLLQPTSSSLDKEKIVSRAIMLLYLQSKALCMYVCKYVCVLVAQLCPTLMQPHGL